MPLKNILALSSSRVGNSAYLEKALPLIEKFLGNTTLNIAFIPFASVTKSHYEYLSLVNEGLKELQHCLHLVEPGNAKSVIESCDVIMIGGGNTFKLLHDIYKHNLYYSIINKVQSGTPYIGWSAGSNITGKTIGTTNDMPIIEPQSFKAFGFFPFQINPHYLNVKPEEHNGETRDERLLEFLKLNPSSAIIGLPEGTSLQLKNNKIDFLGEQPGVLFHPNETKVKIAAGSDLSYLL